MNLAGKLEESSGVFLAAVCVGVTVGLVWNCLLFLECVVFIPAAFLCLSFLSLVS